MTEPIWPSLWRQFWHLIGPQRRKGVRRCPYFPCADPDCRFSHDSADPRAS